MPVCQCWHTKVSGTVLPLENRGFLSSSPSFSSSLLPSLSDHTGCVEMCIISSFHHQRKKMCFQSVRVNGRIIRKEVTKKEVDWKTKMISLLPFPPLQVRFSSSLCEATRSSYRWYWWLKERENHSNGRGQDKSKGITQVIEDYTFSLSSFSLPFSLSI